MALLSLARLADGKKILAVNMQMTWTVRDEV